MPAFNIDDKMEVKDGFNFNSIDCQNNANFKSKLVNIPYSYAENFRQRMMYKNIAQIYGQ